MGGPQSSTTTTPIRGNDTRDYPRQSKRIGQPATTGGATVEFRLHDTTVAGGGTSPVQIVTIPTVGGGSSYGSAAPAWLFNSGTADPKTNALEARVTSGSALAVRTSSSVTASFSPFGADGAAQELAR